MDGDIVNAVFIGLQYKNFDWKWLDGTAFDYEQWGPDRPLDPVNRTHAYIFPNPIISQTDWAQKWSNYELIPLDRFVFFLTLSNSLHFNYSGRYTLRVQENTGFTVRICGSDLRLAKFCYNGKAIGNEHQSCSDDDYCGIQAVQIPGIDYLSGFYGGIAGQFFPPCLVVEVEKYVQTALNLKKTSVLGSCYWNVTDDGKLEVDVVIPYNYTIEVEGVEIYKRRLAWYEKIIDDLEKLGPPPMWVYFVLGASLLIAVVIIGCIIWDCIQSRKEEEEEKKKNEGQLREVVVQEQRPEDASQSLRQQSEQQRPTMDHENNERVREVVILSASSGRGQQQRNVESSERFLEDVLQTSPEQETGDEETLSEVRFEEVARSSQQPANVVQPSPVPAPANQEVANEPVANAQVVANQPIANEQAAVANVPERVEESSDESSETSSESSSEDETEEILVVEADAFSVSRPEVQLFDKVMIPIISNALTATRRVENEAF
uniref:C-type lectin domain-containing protein n=1 Tax=Panagrolaimus sp. JU765 TaxID=591449 RepID=A0AC34RBF3_9BILA